MSETHTHADCSATYRHEVQQSVALIEPNWPTNRTGSFHTNLEAPSANVDLVQSYNPLLMFQPGSQIRQIDFVPRAEKPLRPDLKRSQQIFLVLDLLKLIRFTKWEKLQTPTNNISDVTFQCY